MTRLVAIFLVSLLTGCAATDVVARYATSSFAAIAGVMGSVTLPGEQGVAVVAPDGERFELMTDLAGPVDAILRLDAEPFLAAGVDPDRLPSGSGRSWSLEGPYLVGRFDLAAAGKAASTEPAVVMASLAASARQRIGYHTAGKHYGVMLSDEAMLEWAADAAANAKDWILILDPAFVATAGGNPAAVTGWLQARIPVDGPDGKMIEVEKLVKPYDIVIR
jgi:hypothetical protein